MQFDLTHKPRQFAGGLASLNYLLNIDGEQWALRRSPPGELLPGANGMRRGFTILKSSWQAFVAGAEGHPFLG